MNVTFGNVGGNVEGNTFARDIIQRSGLHAEDQVKMEQMIAELETVLAEKTPPEQKVSRLSAILKPLFGLSVDVAAKVLPQVLLKFL